MKRRLVHWSLILALATTANVQAQNIDLSAWQVASEEHPCDVTALLQNPAGTENYGWNRHSSDAAAGYNKRNTEFANSLYSGIGIESWYWSPVKGGTLIWQDVTELLPGTYRVTAYVVGQIYNNSARKGQCGKGTYLFANEAQTAITSAKWQELTATTTVGEDRRLRLGIKADTQNENDWVSIAHVKVLCTGFAGISSLPTTVLDERYDVSAARETGVSHIRLHRTLSDSGLTPVCFPFDMSEEETATYFTEVQEVTEASLATDGSVNYETRSVKALKAATPYLVRARRGGRQLIEVPMAILHPLNEARPVIRSFNKTQAIGTYRAQEAIPGIGKVNGYSFYITAK